MTVMDLWAWFWVGYVVIGATMCFWIARNSYADIASDDLDEDFRMFIPFFSILYGLLWPLILLGMGIYWVAHRKKSTANN